MARGVVVIAVTVLFTMAVGASAQMAMRTPQVQGVWNPVVGSRPAMAQNKPAGVPVPEDSPIFKAFKLLEKQPGYRTTMVIEPSDPKMAQMMKQGMGMTPLETVVRGGARQVSFHYKMPAMDQPGTVDDWEIRAVVKDGRGARLITSPVAPRIMRYSEQMVAMQMAMLDRQASMAIAHAAAQGPMGGITAGLAAGEMAIGNIMAARGLKKEKEFFSWKCMDQLGGGQKGDQKTNQLTDMRPLRDQSLNGTPVTAYEFFVRDGDKLQGPVHLLVAKDTGLPLRIEMTDPQGHGSMHMDYSYDQVADIEIPGCLASGQ